MSFEQKDSCVVARLVHDNRSVRRFEQSRPLTEQTLRELVELARLTPCHRNAQQLRFRLVSAAGEMEAIFPHLTFGAALGAEGRPREGQRPAAYIVVATEAEAIPFLWCDVGAACQSMLLGACARGLSGCILGGIKREAVAQALALPPGLQILAVLALGYPAERVVLEPAREGQLKYWREREEHHVPKLGLDDIII